MHDIVVVSDLHLGRGKNHATGRYYRLEAFFYDDDFERFCRWVCADADERRVEVVLVLAGDTFDLLRIDPKPRPDATAAERRYGPLMNPAQAVETMGDILAGHPRFVSGLAQVLSQGHRVVFLPGNHDPEIQWPSVQAVVMEALIAEVTAQSDPGLAARARDRVTFAPWFYYEPGRVWIEHGCQYDLENSCRYPLRGALDGEAEAMTKAAADLPMGSFFQRYLYNGFGNLTFIVPSSRSNSRYVRWLILNEPRLLFRVLTSHAPFFFQMVRRLAHPGARTEEIRSMHEVALEALAERSGLGETLLAIDALKRVRGSAAVVARQLLGQGLRIVLLSVLVTLLGAGLWFAGFFAINQMSGGFGVKTVAFMALNLVFLLSLLGSIGYFIVRRGGDATSEPLQRAAEQIAKLLDVPIVAFGHSHEEVIHRADELEPPIASPAPSARWYYNTGTWIAVFTHDALIPRERVQYTFLRIRGARGELLHWSPGRAEATQVVLLEAPTPRGAVHLASHPPVTKI